MGTNYTPSHNMSFLSTGTEYLFVKVLFEAQNMQTGLLMQLIKRKISEKYRPEPNVLV